MSAWGSGSFENDDARNCLGALHAKALDDLRQILDSAAKQEDYLESSEAGATVAAAEVIAALNGAPPQPLPREIAEWLSKAPVASPDLITVARQAVHRVRVNSELKDLGLQADGLNEWSACLRDLEQRLS